MTRSNQTSITPANVGDYIMYKPAIMITKAKTKASPILAKAFRNGRRYVWINYSKASLKNIA